MREAPEAAWRSNGAAAYASATAVVVLLLVPFACNSSFAVGRATSWRTLGSALGGGHHLHHGELGPTSSPPEAAARDHFEAVFTSYLRRHQATVALLDGPEPWADPEAAARMRLVGLGNRLPGLVTAFALALLTDRVLLVSEARGPFFGMFRPTLDCNYTQSRRGSPVMTGSDWDVRDICSAHHADLEVMAAKGAPSYRETRLFERTEVPFLLDDLGARYKDFTVLHYRSHDYQLPLLAANEHYRQFLGKLRPNFGIIGAPLLRPKPQLAADAAQLFAAKVPPGALVVGVHIRLHKRGSYVPPVRWYADTALVIGLSKELPERLRFFVAADDRRAITEFEDAVMETLRRDYNVTTAAVFQWPDPAQNRSRIADRAARDARRGSDLVDMLILGLCNETVLTYGSSFGYVATALALRPPHYQQHLYHDNVYQDPAAVGGRRAAPHERVADDHVFSRKALIAEPCYWDSKRLLTGAFSRDDAKLHSRLMAAFRSNVYWQQYSQCHWAPDRPCGDLNATCDEEEGRVY